jgi:hypothetical protein
MLTDAILGDPSMIQSHNELAKANLRHLDGPDGSSEDDFSPDPNLMRIGTNATLSINGSTASGIKHAVSVGNLIDFDDNASLKSAGSIHERASDGTMALMTAAGATFTKASVDPLGSWSSRMV